MAARRGGAVVVGSLLLALTACSGTPAADLGASTQTPSPPATPSATASSSASPTVTASAKKAADPSRKYAVVTLGKFAKDPAAQGFQAFAVARTEATLKRDSKLPSLVRSTSSSYRRFLAGEYVTLRKRGWSTAAPTRWALMAASRQSSAARLRACYWGPSATYIDAKTRKDVEKLESRWYSVDVTMAKRGSVWLVHSIYAGKSSCSGAKA